MIDDSNFGNEDRAAKLFSAYDDDADGLIPAKFLINELEENGIHLNDIRLKPLQDMINSLPNGLKSSLNQKNIDDILKSSCGELFHKALTGRLVVPDFANLKSTLENIYHQVKDIKEGKNASYIPQLAEVDPDLYAISVCTVDGQMWSIGDADFDYCLQSCSKPISYCIALEQHGLEKVHSHVGREPSGHKFNKNFLSQRNRPHNPMINSGAIMISSLICQNTPLFKKFEHYRNICSDLAGGAKIGFQNSVYLSERESASRNHCLAYMMMDAGAFPENVSLDEVVDFYFQACSVEANANKMATMASNLANGGKCIFTGKRIFKEETVNSALSLMHSCGMYDFSGEWAFSVGIPAKSGVSGCIFLVIPNVMGICVFSPPLDERGNSVKGIETCKLLVKEYSLHRYDSIKGLITPFGSRRDILMKENELLLSYIIRWTIAAENNDLNEMQMLYEEGSEKGSMDVNKICDYDKVNAVHIACSKDNKEVLEFLLEHGGEVAGVVDRWGLDGLQRAEKEGHYESIVNILKEMAISESDNDRSSYMKAV